VPAAPSAPADDTLTRQAYALVQHFHQRFHGTPDVAPSAKALTQASTLIARYGPEQASASSTLNFGVQSLQFRSGVVDFELPVDAALLSVGLVGPDPDLGLEQR